MRLTGAERQRFREATGFLLGDDARLAAHRDRVRMLIERTDPEAALEYWLVERVAALAVHRAAEIGVERRLWATEASQLRSSATDATGMADLLLIQATRRLADHGIPAVVLKGRSLATRLYVDPLLRSRSQDADLLVPSEQLFAAKDLLVAMGWPQPSDPLLGNGLPALHLCLPGVGRLPIVELHWRVQWYDSHDHARGLLAHVEMLDGLPVLGDVDLLDLLLLCWARDGFQRLRLGADIAAWWRTYGSFRARDVERIYEAPHTGRPAMLAAAAAARLFGTPPPPSQPPDRRARISLAVAQSSATPPGTPRTLTQSALVDVLVCPPVQIRRRLNTSWLLDGHLSQRAHQWAPPALVPVLRVASAVRTGLGSVSILARAMRYGRSQTD